MYTYFVQPVTEQGICQQGSQPIGLLKLSLVVLHEHLPQAHRHLNLCSRPFKVSFIAQHHPERDEYRLFFLASRVCRQCTIGASWYELPNKPSHLHLTSLWSRDRIPQLSFKSTFLGLELRSYLWIRCAMQSPHFWEFCFWLGPNSEETGNQYISFESFFF